MSKKYLVFCLMAFVFIGNTNAVYGKDIFRVGERMIYAIKWKNLRIGINVVELRDTEIIKNTNSYHVVSETETQGVVNLFFKVRDRVETFIDTKNHYPLLYKKNINEGKYHKMAAYEFNHDIGIVDTSLERYNVPKGIQDPLSILAYFRSLDIKVNDIVDLKYFSGNEVQIVRVNVVKEETIEIPLGKYNTKLVSFSVGKEERTYLKNQVVMWIWFSNDEKKIPVLAKCNTAYGVVTGTLIDYQEGE